MNAKDNTLINQVLANQKESAAEAKELLNEIHKLNLAFQIDKVKNEKLHPRVKCLEEGQEDIKEKIAEIRGFFKYAKWLVTAVAGILTYFGFKIIVE